jgi:hypothetical protein
MMIVYITTTAIMIMLLILPESNLTASRLVIVVQVLRLNRDIEEKEQQRRYLPLLDPERADLDAQIDELQQQKADLQAASRQVVIQVQHSPIPPPKHKN